MGIWEREGIRLTSMLVPEDPFNYQRTHLITGAHAKLTLWQSWRSHY